MAENGPFKSFRIIWLPYTNPAVVISMAAFLVFYLANALLVFTDPGFETGADGVMLFAVGCGSVITSLSLDGLPLAGWAFVVQVVVALICWGTFGVAVCRCMALRFTRDEYLGVGDALAFGFGQASTSLLFPVIVGGCIATLLLVNLALGALMAIPGVGVVFYVLLPIAYLAGLMTIVIALSAFFGIGMVSAAVAVERRGTLDSWGKALNYIFARPIHFVIHIAVVKLLLVDVLARYTLGERMLHRWVEKSLTPFWNRESFGRVVRFDDDLSLLETVQAVIWRGFDLTMTLFLVGLLINLALSAFTAMFLIFRSEVDGIDTSDIELDTPADDPAPEAVSTPPSPAAEP